MSALQHQQWSEEKQRYIPLAFHKCDRCGRTHSKVYRVEVGGRLMSVGPQCVLRLLEAIPATERRPMVIPSSSGLRVAPSAPDVTWVEPEPELHPATLASRLLRAIGM